MPIFLDKIWDIFIFVRIGYGLKSDPTIDHLSIEVELNDDEDILPNAPTLNKINLSQEMEMDEYIKTTTSTAEATETRATTVDVSENHQNETILYQE